MSMEYSKQFCVCDACGQKQEASTIGTSPLGWADQARLRESAHHFCPDCIELLIRVRKAVSYELVFDPPLTPEPTVGAETAVK